MLRTDPERGTCWFVTIDGSLLQKERAAAMRMAIWRGDYGGAKAPTGPLDWTNEGPDCRHGGFVVAIYGAFMG